MELVTGLEPVTWCNIAHKGKLRIGIVKRYIDLVIPGHKESLQNKKERLYHLSLSGAGDRTPTGDLVQHCP